MIRAIRATSCLLLFCSVVLHSQPQREAALWNFFESAQALQSVKVENGSISRTSEDATDGHAGIKVIFAGSGSTSLRFQNAGGPWDWSAYGGIAFELINPSADEISYSVRITDNSSNVVSGNGEIGPGLKVTYVYPLGPTSPADYGMVGAPPFPGIVPVTYVAKTRIDERHVREFVLSFAKPRSASGVFLDNLRFLPPVSYDTIVDQFGQYRRENWAGKLKQEAEIPLRRKQEESEIVSTPALADRDEYGGWASGPQLPPLGFFATVQRDGKWWLVDPRGHLFFSVGIDSISLHESQTLIEGRERMFTWLPGADDPLAKHFGYADQVLYGPIKKGRSFDFYGANLERKYGANFTQLWRSFALDRIHSWGFNTLANWSDPGLFSRKLVPYTATLGIHGDYARVSSGVDFWGKMHDVFDPRFAAAVDASMRKGTKKYRDDPWCIGYFIDNEIAWGGGEDERQHYGLAYGTLAADSDSPAKKAFLRQLRGHYKRIAALNNAWNTDFKSWKQLLQNSYRPNSALTVQMKSDFQVFVAAFAEQYFRIIRDAVKKYDPNHLYLGCRFAWSTPEAVKAAGQYADVVSFNVYRSHLETSFCPPELHKPCLVGEFHFGAMDSGMFHTGLIMAPDQQARAELYRQFLGSALDNPAVVGVHWFQYVDEPLTGRTYDGENYNIGFVDVTDTPYPEMVGAARAIHATVYERHSAK
jgi:hypothetical protein